ncbi:unnamed protein product [Porites evermanni]|uniref:UBX domain-containing protein n=1 Tax=Porites evermanni TaxID=104178 RepID=A0ABN8R5F4_9CNID|nr:unnamed protein product [Porites evermanni]
MAFDKTWIVLIAGCGVLGLAFWGGMNAMTLKMTLLWLFISFGFLTLIMHLFGSPISLLLGKVLQTSSDGSCKKARYSDAELNEKRKRILQMKQFLQDNKVDIYKENVLAPREEALRAKKEAEFYKFNSNWKGKGFRLRDDGQVEGEGDFFSQEFSDDENDSSEEGSDAVNTSDTTQENVSTWKSKQEFLRQRKQTYELPDEPELQERGVITVALRCPNGAVKRRRFTVESQIKMLYVFAEWIGYSSSRYVISTTFPRKQLSEVTQTFLEAGLAGDTALVLEEI